MPVFHLNITICTLHLHTQTHTHFAERGGFEPPVRRLADNGFRDRRIRPLCHLSEEGVSVSVQVKCECGVGVGMGMGMGVGANP